MSSAPSSSSDEGASTVSRVSRKSLASRLEYAAIARVGDAVKDDAEMLSTWSWVKFAGRLDLMHEVFTQWSDDPDNFKLDPLSNPWAEYGPVDLKDMQMEAQKALMQRDAELNRLREQNRELRAKLDEATLANAKPQIRSYLSFGSEDGSGGIDEQVKRCAGVTRESQELVDKLMTMLAAPQ